MQWIEILRRFPRRFFDDMISLSWARPLILLPCLLMASCDDDLFLNMEDTPPPAAQASAVPMSSVQSNKAYAGRFFVAGNHIITPYNGGLGGGLGNGGLFELGGSTHIYIENYRPVTDLAVDPGLVILMYGGYMQYVSSPLLPPERETTQIRFWAGSLRIWGANVLCSVNADGTGKVTVKSGVATFQSTRGGAPIRINANQYLNF